MKKTITLVFLLMTVNAIAQNKETIYLTKGDTLQNYYTTLIPDSASKGLLVILGGFCTNPEEIMQETNLPVTACKAGYTVVMPYLLNDCDSIDIKNVYPTRLMTLVPQFIKKYNIPSGKFIIGGHSLGGHRALFYAEQVFKLNNANVIKPTAVFGVDPPLNLRRLWNGFEYGAKIAFSKTGSQESTEQMRRFKIIYGGSPSQVPKKYEAFSSYYPDAIDGGNIKYLKNIPVRLYCDPDVKWWVENRRSRLEHVNLTDLVGAISQLKLLGNQKAELITALGKGFWANGQRHPHAFSILDADEFVTWANTILSAK
ncbi:MAG: hypothetical protein JNK27_05835 [Chitinophagaceae bacterium]|nr:hypothetical protein [Chitinophagaceae bacterium]